MPPTGNNLDLILKTRLDVLDQAVDEVRGVIGAMDAQRKLLAQVEAFLADAGRLSQVEGNLLELVGDISTRLNVLLRAARRPRSPTPEPDPGPPGALSQAEPNERLQKALERAEEAKAEVDSIARDRQAVYESFQSVRHWSVAGLADTALTEAVSDYQRLIEEIRRAEHPWHRYLAEMPRRGHELFSRYLELLAGMAVRGFGLDRPIVSDVEALIKLLLGPVPGPSRPTEQQSSPLGLMSTLGRRHMPLGYPEWSLWALPLVGRPVGEMVATWILPPGTDARLRVLCADLYAQYALGPSYLHAAVFLEFEPTPEPATPDGPSDALRAAVLLEHLPDMADPEEEEQRKLVVQITERVATEWRRARDAVGGKEPTFDSDSRLVVDGFLQELTQFKEVRYPAEYLADNVEAGKELAGPTGQGAPDPASLPSMQLRELINAMWLARLEDPTRARAIHERAKSVARQGPGIPPSSGVGLRTKSV